MENGENGTEQTEENEYRPSRPSFLDRESSVTTTLTTTEQNDEPKEEDEVSNIFSKKEKQIIQIKLSDDEIAPDDMEGQESTDQQQAIDENGETEEDTEGKGETEGETEEKGEAQGEIETSGDAEGERKKSGGTEELKSKTDGEPDSEERESDETKDEMDEHMKGVTISDYPRTKIYDATKEVDQKESEDHSEGKMDEETEDTEPDQKLAGQKMSVSSRQSTFSARHSRVTISERPTEMDRSRLRARRSTRKSKSIVYDIGPRFNFDDDDRMTRPSGDFGFKSDAEEGDVVRFYSYMDDEAEEEEEEIIVEEEEIERIDRTPYYEREVVIRKEIELKKIRNFILQKKLAMFFKRRKMDRVLHETDQQFDTQQKYGKKLDLYGELMELDTSQRNTITSELDNLKQRRESKFNELNKLFENMQERENEIGLGLIDTKTGKPIPDKLVERLIRRQKVQMDEVSAMRLNFIKLKEMVAEKENAISDLDQIGDGLYLMDYEQLKVENRSHADKIEEKEEDLTRLRFKCQNTIQILAHIREKSSALDSDLDDIKDDMAMVQFENFQVRAQLNGLKQERDYYRSLTNKLRNDSGLLTQPELLRDMESSMEEYKTIYVELENLKQDNKKKTLQIRNIRKNMEFAADMGTRKSFKNVLSKPVYKPRFHKGRPSLLNPTISIHAFDFLRTKLTMKPPGILTNKQA